MKKLMSIAAAATLVTGLSACGGQDASKSCTTTACTVSLKGEGASQDVTQKNLEITLNGAQGGQAELEIEGGQEVRCKQGETVNGAGLKVLCKTVKNDEVVLDVTAA